MGLGVWRDVQQQETSQNSCWQLGLTLLATCLHQPHIIPAGGRLRLHTPPNAFQCCCRSLSLVLFFEP